MGIELSFPIPEGITVATISVCVEIVSMTATSFYGLAIKEFGDLKSNIGVWFLLFLSTIAMSFVPPNFKREEVERSVKSPEVKELLYSAEKKPIVIAASTVNKESTTP